MADVFMSQVGLNPDTWEESKRLGPSTVPVVCRWTAPDSGFRPFRRVPSLHAPFEKFAKDNKPLYDFALSSLGSSLAVAHPSLHAAAFIGEFLQRLPTVLEGPYWAQFCIDEEHAFAADVIFPLRDAACCLAGSVGRSITAVRSGGSGRTRSAMGLLPGLRVSSPSSSLCHSEYCSLLRRLPPRDPLLASP